jgi:hypothetical protein
VPQLVHHAAADGRNAVGAAEAESLLNARVKALEVGAQSALVD